MAATALRQANNSLNSAVQMLQEEPDLIALAAQEREVMDTEPSDEMIANVVAMGFLPEMAAIALKNEGSIEGAVDKLTEGGGVVVPLVEEDNTRDSKRARKDAQDEEAYNRIKEDIAEHEEDHLDMDLVEEGQLLRQYLSLLNHIKI